MRLKFFTSATFYLLLSGLFLLPSILTHASSQPRVQGQIADQLAKGMYCNAFDFLAGDFGIILGLLVGFAGFLIMIFKQLHFTGFVMILGGVCLTALPFFLETTFESITVMAKQQNIVNNSFSRHDHGRRHLGDCSMYNNIRLTFIDQTLISEGSGGGTGGGTGEFGGSNATIDGMIDDILRREGGFVNDPSDSGGATNMGITRATLSSYLGRPATIQDVRNLSAATAREIYRTRYAPSASTPSHLRALAFDSNVNHGRGGHNTIMRNATRLAGGGTPQQSHYIQARINYYVGIIRRRPKDMKFANGWTNRMREFGYTGPEIRNLV